MRLFLLGFRFLFVFVLLRLLGFGFLLRLLDPLLVLLLGFLLENVFRFFRLLDFFLERFGVAFGYCRARLAEIVFFVRNELIYNGAGVFPFVLDRKSVV